VTGATQSTLAEVVERTLEPYEQLSGLGETIEDEWSYVGDLSTAWRDRLADVVVARGDEPVPPPVVDAIERAIDEIARIDDPHRAIDWLSTFPQVVLLALGEEP
jgi:hypothetical protein